jgi:hypothetical protein
MPRTWDLCPGLLKPPTGNKTIDIIQSKKNRSTDALTSTLINIENIMLSKRSQPQRSSIALLLESEVSTAPRPTKPQKTEVGGRNQAYSRPALGGQWRRFSFSNLCLRDLSVCKEWRAFMSQWDNGQEIPGPGEVFLFRATSPSSLESCLDQRLHFLLQ